MGGMDFWRLAGDFALLATVIGAGYAAGFWTQRQAHQRSALKIQDQLEQQTALTEATRKQCDAAYDEAKTWRSRFDELKPTVSADQVSLRVKIEAIRQFADEEDSHWSRPATQAVLPVHPRNGGAVVLAVANLEGGVGKTTIATHLAGYFAQSAPTLFIDMDYQGSGSTQLLRASGADGPAPESRVERLMGGDGIDVKQLLPISLGARAPGLAVVPSFHSLSRFEDRLMLRWMIGDETDDIRKRLCEALRSQEFQSRFRFIVIDCPPRMTTGMVNALWASTHLLIPTELTKTASEASIYFLERLNVLKQNGFLRGMKIVGVLPSMVESPPRDAHQGPAEKLLREQIDDQSALVLKEQSISRNVAFAKAAATDLVHLAIDSSSESSRRAWKQICDLGDYLRKGFEHDATGVGQPPA